ncbi:MAG: SDR family NAD(P)-dependent oxidoreductase, partial [Desulfobacterales bacterium]
MSKFDLKDKVAIVTGGAGGIGAAIARAFSEAGAKVVVSSRNHANIDRVAADLKASGGESLAIATDVTIPEQVDNMVKQTMDTFGRIDILVNNAGGAMVMGKPEE